MNDSRLAARDQKVIWHPYSQHGLNCAPLPVVSARGAYLQLEDGRLILDAISSWWVNIHGHGHPSIVGAIAKQSSMLDHTIFAGFTHDPAVSLAERLLKAAQRSSMDLERVFYSDNGSTAVEVALKMAYQWQSFAGNSHSKRFLALRHSYHGDTFGAMAVGHPEGFHFRFRELLFPVDFIEPGNMDSLTMALERWPGEHAAIIFEPMIQGASGMRLVDPEWLKKGVDLCRSRGILIIADEVFTGFWRTGRFFACEHLEIAPDLLCLSKGITGGTLPLAVTLATERIFSAFLSKDLSHAFLHGHSYTGNPISCAAAIASFDLLEKEVCQARIKRISEITHECISSFKMHPQVLNARSIGTIGALEFRGDPGYFAGTSRAITSRALELGVLLRPLGNVVYAVPPYCVSDEELYHIYSVMGAAIK